MQNSLYYCHAPSSDYGTVKTEKIYKHVFGTKVNRFKVSAHLESVTLNFTDEASKLGVIIDSYLNFKTSIKTITQKTYYQLKDVFCPKDDTEKLAHVFIFSRLN